MKATINQGSDNEISWSIDDPITPELVEAIEKAGDEIKLQWADSPFMETIDLLLTKYEVEEIEEMLYDEDPKIIEISSLILKNPIDTDPNSELKNIIRLYFPVMVILLKKLKI